jgi:hypothetical protein
VRTALEQQAAAEYNFIFSSTHGARMDAEREPIEAAEAGLWLPGV